MTAPQGHDWAPRPAKIAARRPLDEQPALDAWEWAGIVSVILALALVGALLGGGR